MSEYDSALLLCVGRRKPRCYRISAAATALMYKEKVAAAGAALRHFVSAGQPGTRLDLIFCLIAPGLTRKIAKRAEPKGWHLLARRSGTVRDASGAQLRPRTKAAMATVLKDPLEQDMQVLGHAARAAAQALALASTRRKDTALLACRRRRPARDQPAILDANARDMAAARAKGLSGAMLDRLELTPARVEAMAQGLATSPRSTTRSGPSSPAGAARTARHRPRPRAAGRGRDHLREPPQRHRRCRGLVPQGRQRRHPARRVGELPLLARDRGGLGTRPRRRRPAGGRGPARAHGRPRRRRPSAADEPSISTSSCRAAGAR